VLQYSLLTFDLFGPTSQMDEMMTSFLCLPSDVVGVVCSSLSRVDVINLLFRTCSALRKREHWEQALLNLVLFRQIMTLRRPGCSVLSFFAEVASLEAFRGCNFLDNVVISKSEQELKGNTQLKVVFPAKHRCFLQFSLATKSPSLFAVFGVAASPSPFQHLHSVKLRGLKWSWNNLSIVSREEFDEWKFEAFLTVVIVEEITSKDFVFPAFVLRKKLCIFSPHEKEENKFAEISQRPLFLQRHKRWQTDWLFEI
jgi:hypothetical protein